MKFENTQVFNIDGAFRGMRFPMKGTGDTFDDIIGAADMKVADKLYRASELDNLAHSKFLRQIFVSVDISAPIYFWQEMDTYKISTTANSESTMHKLTKDAKNLTIDDFAADDRVKIDITQNVIPRLQEISNDISLTEIERLRYLKQLLPTSYIQKRHWTANYEVVRNIYRQRHNHRLLEWNTNFVVWAESLPYAKHFIIKRIKGE